MRAGRCVGRSFIDREPIGFGLVLVLASTIVARGTEAPRPAPTPPKEPISAERTCPAAIIGEPTVFTETSSYCGGGDFTIDPHWAYWSSDCQSIDRCDRPSCAKKPERIVADEQVRALATDGALHRPKPPADR